MQEREFPLVLFLVMIRARLKGAGLRWRKARHVLRKMGFPNLAPARTRRAQLRLERCTAFPALALTMFMADLDPDHEASREMRRHAEIEDE